jgi:hypothetical protein
MPQQRNIIFTLKMVKINVYYLNSLRLSKKTNVEN